MNISLPSPPIGDQIPTVPDAPWTASNLDLDLLIKEEIGFGCPRNGPRLPMEGHQMSAPKVGSKVRNFQEKFIELT